MFYLVNMIIIILLILIFIFLFNLLLSKREDFNSQNIEYSKKNSNYIKSLNEINYERTGNPAWIKNNCPKLPDMNKYIKKNSIPCWGCNIPDIKICKKYNRLPMNNHYPENCPKKPNMDEYIRIDEIPCYNCKIPLKKCYN